MPDAPAGPRLNPPKSRLVRALFNLIRPMMVKIQYNYVNRLDRNDHQIALMNYGYVPLDPNDPVPVLTDVPENDRYALQLYHAVAGAVDLTGKEVLEVGSGRGGGAAYIAKRLGPRSVTAVDLCKSSVAYCRSRYAIDNLTFDRADAQALPFPDTSFDAVISVESSHCYNRPGSFFGGAYRVLRPGGHLLYTDFQVNDGMERFAGMLRETGFQIVQDAVINANVFAALQQESERKRAYILAKVPRSQQPQFFMFAAVEGSDMYDAIQTGRAQYRRFVARKPAGEG